MAVLCRHIPDRHELELGPTIGEVPVLLNAISAGVLQEVD